MQKFISQRQASHIFIVKDQVGWGGGKGVVVRNINIDNLRI